MKIKLSTLAVLASGLMATSSYATQNEETTGRTNIIPGKEKLETAIANKVRQDSMYYVILQDKALAGYHNTQSVGVMGNQVAPSRLNTKTASSQSYINTLKSKQASVLSSASQLLKRKVSAKYQYQIALNGMAVELTEAEAAQLKTLHGVKSVEKIGFHRLHTYAGPDFIGATQVWKGVEGSTKTQGENVIVGIIDTGINATHESFADIGADGYDHTNPLGEGNYLGDCIEYAKFCNDKLIGIVSYPEIINIRPEPTNHGYEDIEDKLKVGYDFHGHGSHVGSTAAGNILNNVPHYMAVSDDIGPISEKTNFEYQQVSGVAPHANIVSYQVCDHSGSCWPELTVLAVEHAIENGVDVINYSVGGGASNPWTDADAMAFLNARAAGIHVATSAGNSGPYESTIGSPGNAPWVTTVAAYTHDGGFSNKTLSNFSGGDNTPTTDITGEGATKAYTGKVVLAESYGDAQCSEPFEAGTFNGEIVLCERGGFARVRKGINVKEGGAGGLILINLAGEAENLEPDSHVLPAIQVNATDGETLVNWLSEGENHQATIGEAVQINDTEKGDIAGNFTSRGPNLPYPNIFSPDIAGPGVNIYAAGAEETPFTAEDNGVPYVTMSGTSMSSPHVAGVLALIHSSNPTWTPAQVQSAVMSTAHRITYKDDFGTGVLERSDFFDQGAGSVRVHHAINAGLILDISEQEYLDAAPEAGGDPRTLNTTSMVDNDCLVSCQWTRVVEATKDGTWSASYEYLNPGFELSVSPASFSLKKGEKQTLTFTASTNAELEDLTVHGYTVLNAEGENISDSHFQATVGFIAGLLPEVHEHTYNNDEIIIKDIQTTGSNDLQVKGFGFVKAKTATGTAAGASNDSERAYFHQYHDTIFSHPIVVKPYTKRLVVEIIDSEAPDMDLYVGIDEDGDGYPNYTEAYYSTLCISGQVDSNEMCMIKNPPTGNYWLVAHNFRGTADGSEDSVTIRYTAIEYTPEESFANDAPKEVERDAIFDINLAVNGYKDDNDELVPLEEYSTYYGLVEIGTSATLKRNVGATLIQLNTNEIVEEVNYAPVVENEIADINASIEEGETYSLEIDLSEVFSDPDGDELTLSVSGFDAATLEGSMLTASLTEATNLTVTVTASDGEIQASASFKVVLEVTQAPIVTPPPPVTPEKLSGGSLSTVLLALATIFIVRRRKLTK